MFSVQPKYRKLVLVCTNDRDPKERESCARKGSVELHQKIKEAVKAVTFDVRVSKSGCLDHCSTGITVVIMPDNIWFGGVTEKDIPLIISMIH